MNIQERITAQIARIEKDEQTISQLNDALVETLRPGTTPPANTKFLLEFYDMKLRELELNRNNLRTLRVESQNLERSEKTPDLGTKAAK